MSILSMETSNVFAGSGATAISTRSVIYYLLKNLKYKRRLMEEIDAYKRDGSLTEPITLEQTKYMPYLQACLYEGLHCHPAVGISLPPVTPPGGVEIDSRYIPEGVGSPGTSLLKTNVTSDRDWCQSVGCSQGYGGLRRRCRIFQSGTLAR